MINPNLEDHINALSAYLPNGHLFGAKNIHDSNFRQLLRGLAGELFTGQGYLVTLNNEYFPDETNLFLTEWENALGIPDLCFSGEGTLDERRRDVLVKLASLGVQTAEDFISLGEIFGITIQVESGNVNGLFPLEFPLIFFGSATEARFTIIVTFTVPAGIDVFPFEFPFILGNESIFTLECLFRKLKPANCNIIFEQI